MGYYEEKRNELENLLAFVKKEQEFFKENAKNELKILEKLSQGVIQMAKERQIGFPWLAKAYDELFLIEEKLLIESLRTKKHPAYHAAETVRRQSALRRQAERDKKIAQYIVDYYENIAPFLVDLKEEIDIGVETETGEDFSKDYSDEEKQDSTTFYLTKEEYRKLPNSTRNQLALDRFWQRPKSKWLIGRLYERYVGHLYECQGYNVDYVGIFKGFEDLGRDLICKKRDEVIIIQCKNWSKFKTIYEKHIFQFFGTVFQYKDENPGKKVRAIFYTSTELSKLARRFSKELGIELKEKFKFDKEYPSIKCHISKTDRTKIYHLPFDQQYDKTKLEKKHGEFYCKTVKEAEKAGFRRAFRYRAISNN